MIRRRTCKDSFLSLPNVTPGLMPGKLCTIFRNVFHQDEPDVDVSLLVTSLLSSD